MRNTDPTKNGSEPSCSLHIHTCIVSFATVDILPTTPRYSWNTAKVGVKHQSIETPREPRGIEMGPRASSAWRGVRQLCGMYKFTTNPSFGWDVNKTIKPRSRVERLPSSSHVREPSVTAHYEHYAHDEWSIRNLLHWLNYPFLPITFPCFESRGF